MALTPRLSSLAANAEADAVTALLDGGELRIYSGAQPADANNAPAGTLLVALAFGSPAFGAAAGGVATANPLTPGTAVADGAAAWFRAVTAGGATVLDGAAGTSGANLILATTTIGAGAVVSIDSFLYTATRQ